MATGQALDFETAAVAQGVTLGLFDKGHNVLLGVGARGVLRFNRHAIEDAQVVEFPLRFHDFPLAQGLSRAHEKMTTDDTGPCVMVTAEQ